MIRFYIFCAAVICPFYSVMAVEVVTLWTYHAFPPFVVDLEKNQGLTYDLAEELNQRSEGEYDFQVRVLPRVRLNQRLKSDFVGVVAWVNPAWFGDKDKTKYLWSDQLIEDRNSVISPSSVPVEYLEPTSLKGMEVAGVLGHKYIGIDDLVATDEIQRIDLEREEQVVLMIAEGKANAAPLAELAARYYINSLGLEQWIHFSKIPHSTMKRSFLLHRDLTEVQIYLNQVIAELSEESYWEAMLNKYLHESDAFQRYSLLLERPDQD